MSAIGLMGLFGNHLPNGQMLQPPAPPMPPTQNPFDNAVTGLAGNSPLMRAAGGPGPKGALSGPEISGPGMIGQAMSTAVMPHMGMVSGPGDGRSDSVDAKLSDGEYVWPADVVSALGNGSNQAGAKQLDQMVTNIRQHNIKKLGALPAPVK
jgi:hypothetical protein